jgi:hypothetical protein
MRICEHFLMLKEDAEVDFYDRTARPTTNQRPGSGAFMEMAGAVLSVALMAFLDGIKDVDVTQAVASYLNDAFPDHVKKLLE